MIKQDRWSFKLLERQLVFMPPHLGLAVNFLQEARTDGQGWGPYPTMTSDIYHTSRAIEALSVCGADTSVGLVADSILYLKDFLEGSLDQLDIVQLSALLNVATCEERRDLQFCRDLVGLARSRLALHRENDSLSMFYLSSILLSLHDLERSDDDYFMFWMKFVIQAQNARDGGWPLMHGDASSLLGSAAAVRFLLRFDTEEAVSSRRRGIKFMESSISEIGGWRNVASLYQQSIILRSLAEDSMADFDLVVAGADELLAASNSGGGWGGAVGEASNVECTALSLLALVSSGYNRFVPARLTLAALREAQEIIDSAEAERGRLSMDFDKKVQLQCGKVAKERDRLRQDVESLSDRVQLLEGQTEQQRRQLQDAHKRAKQTAIYGEIRNTVSPGASNSKIPLMFSALAGAGLVFWLISVPEMLGVDTTAFVRWVGPIFSAGAIAYVALRSYAQLRSRWLRKAQMEATDVRAELSLPDIEESGSMIFVLSHRFRAAIEGLELPLREELVYRLFRDYIDMPADVGRRSMEDLILRLDLPRQNAALLINWFYLVSTLRPKERRLLFDQIRRSVL